MNASKNVVSIKSLGVVAGGRNILADVTFSVGSRERVAIIGANGAGKTTLFKVMTGMIFPDSGSVEVLGQSVAKRASPIELRKLRARIGQVFQGLHLVGRLSAEENVLIGALGRSTSLFTCVRIFTPDERARADAALKAVGMAHAAKFRVDRLSGGERQKIAVARALNQDPQLILADEPTANLDPTAAGEIADLLTRIAEERQITLITIAHAMTLLPNLARRIVGLKSGRIAFDQSIENADNNQLLQLYYADPVRMD